MGGTRGPHTEAAKMKNWRMIFKGDGNKRSAGTPGLIPSIYRRAVARCKATCENTGTLGENGTRGGTRHTTIRGPFGES